MTKSHPVRIAVTPLKESAVNHAFEQYKTFLDGLKNKIEEADFNIDAVAPHPKSNTDRATYHQMMDMHIICCKITTRPPVQMPNKPLIATGFNQSGYDALLRNVKEDAGASFDAYIEKLIIKVGDCDDAQIKGELWDNSILTVKKGDMEEQWKTQMIVNISKLGKLFNQWPTRKINGTKKGLSALWCCSS
jgi:hypothetical protein